jgi:hypothetical protein
MAHGKARRRQGGAWNRDHRAVNGETAYTTMATWVTNAWEENDANVPHALHFESSGEAMYAAEKMLQDSPQPRLGRASLLPMEEGRQRQPEILKSVRRPGPPAGSSLLMV